MEETVELSFDASEFKEQKSVQHRDSYYGRILEYDMDGTFIRAWRSAAEAALHHGMSSHGLYLCLAGNTLFVNKLKKIFLHEGESIEDRLARIDSESCNPNKKASRIAVDEYDLEGKLICKHASITEAATLIHRSTSAIVRCCRGKSLSMVNRIFLFHGDSIKARLELIQQKEVEEAVKMSVNVYNLKGKFLQAFKTPVEAAEKYGLSPIKVVWCCMGKTESYNGKIFLFSGNSINNRLKKK